MVFMEDVLFFAQEKLKEVIRLLIELKKTQMAVELLEEFEYDAEDPDVFARLDTKFNKNYHKLSYKFFDIIDQIENIGFIVRDFEEGLVDFPTFFNGKQIFLCYKLGEDRIRYWHYKDDGFGGRRPLKELIRTLDK